MSAIAGILYRDARPAHPDSLAPALAEMVAMGSDGTTTWAEGNAALAHLALHTTAESEAERWPLSGPRGTLLIADARLDNRAALLATLRPSAPAARPPTDAELLLAAHERWGDEAPTHLVGDFAYALWEPETQTLRLVRSPFGLKGLFYRVAPDCVLFASTLRGVRALAPTGLSPNLPWIAGFLSFEMDRLHEESVFQEIRKVPPAHLLRFDLATGQVTRHRFWDLTPSEDFATWSVEAWADAFRERFEEGVAASLRTHRTLTMTVSGGLDSSAIALVAHRLMHAEGRVPVLPSYVLTDRMAGWPATDEQGYRDAVIAHLPHFPSEWVDCERVWEWVGVEAWLRHTSEPISVPNTFTMAHRMARAQQLGSRVMLHGTGGDIITGGEDYYYLPAFASLPWPTRLRELRHFTHGSLRGARRFVKEMAREWLPAPVAAWWRSQRCGVTLYREAAVQAARLPAPLVSPQSGESPLQRFLHAVLVQPLYLHPFAQTAEAFALHGLEFRCPFYYRPLVELAFQVPAQLRSGGGETRRLFKRALAADLPPELLARQSKADFTDFTARSVRAADHARAIALPRTAVTRMQGWLDEPTWDRWATTPTRPMQSVLLHRVAHLEYWLAQLGIGV